MGRPERARLPSGWLRVGVVCCLSVWMVSGTARAETVSTATSALPVLTSTASRAPPVLDPLGAADELDDPDDDLSDLPLTPEELALIEALDARAAASSVTPPRPPLESLWPPPTPESGRAHAAPRARLVEPVGRTVTETQEAWPTSRRFAGGPSAPLLLDHVRLHDFAPGAPASGWLGLDPRLLSELRMVTPASGARTTSAGFAALEMFGPAPPESSGASAEVALEARSADRSTGVFARGSAASERAGLSVAGRFDDFSVLRAATEDGPERVPTRAGRQSLSARGRLFGGPTDALTIHLGGELDRNGAKGRDATSQLQLAFLRAELEGNAVSVFALGAYEGYRLRGDSVIDARADLAQAQAGLKWRVAPGLSLSAGGFAGGGDVHPSGAIGGDETRFEGFIGGAFEAGPVGGQATARIAHARMALEDQNGQLDLESTELAGQANLQFRITEPLSIRLGGWRGVDLPNAFELAAADARDVSSLVTTWGAEVGPSLRFADDAWLDATVFVVWAEGLPAQRDSNGRVLEGITALALGAELEGHLSITRRLDATLGATWIDAAHRQSDAQVLRLPAVEGLASLRYRFELYDAFVELHVRAGSPAVRALSHAPSPADDPSYAIGRSPDPEAFARVGVAAGLSLGAGFALHLMLENLLDRPAQLPDIAQPSAGIDLRAALSWAWR